MYRASIKYSIFILVFYFSYESKIYKASLKNFDLVFFYKKKCMSCFGESRNAQSPVRGTFGCRAITHTACTI